MLRGKRSRGIPAEQKTERTDTDANSASDDAVVDRVGVQVSITVDREHFVAGVVSPQITTEPYNSQFFPVAGPPRASPVSPQLTSRTAVDGQQTAQTVVHGIFTVEVHHRRTNERWLVV